MSDRPRDPESEGAGSREEPRPVLDPADEPVTGPPGGTGSRPGGATAAGGAGRRSADARAGAAGATAARNAGARTPAEEARRLRRRRRFLVAGIAAGAAVVVIALCAGTISIFSTVDGFRDRRAHARETRELRDAACLALEQRLNRLTPPGAATSPQARAKAIRDENAAVRIHVNELRDPGTQDGWRQLLDARTAYAEALDAQARSRTPAFYVPPRAADGQAVSDQLIGGSAASCAGPVRRLAVPEL